MLNLKKSKRGVPRMKNPPPPPEISRTETGPENFKDNQVKNTPGFNWDVESFDNPQAACIYINSTGISPEFIYSSSSGKTLVWWKTAK